MATVETVFLQFKIRTEVRTQKIGENLKFDIFLGDMKKKFHKF